DSEDGDRSEGSSRRRRRRRRGASGDGADQDDPPNTVVRVREPRQRSASSEVTSVKGSTRLEAKKQRRREGREAGRRRPSILTEAEFLARREAVERVMVVRQRDDRTQIAVLEDGVLVEHYVNRSTGGSMIGNVYLGKVQNVLPSMEAAFVDVGKGRNAVLYAGEVNWDAAGLEGQPRRIEQALKSGDPVLVQVTKDPIGHKGARLTSQITLAGRYLVYVPAGGMTGISRKLPENERARLKKILKEVVPDAAGVIVRTAAEGASEEELRRDVQRLQDQWAAIEKKAKGATAPALLQGEPDLAIRVVRDIFNDDFTSLVVQGDAAWDQIHEYVDAMAPDLADRVSRYVGTGDIFAEHRIDEQLAKGMDRKVWLPSGGSLVIDRTEAMTVVDVNTGKFTGTGGTLEETVTRNNLEAAEEIVRQLRLRDIGGIIVIDFIDMVLESNRDLVLRRLVECLGRDRTKHQVAEVTSLGLVQMTRKRVGQGLVEAFSETCVHCNGRGFLVHAEPVEARTGGESVDEAPEVGQPHGEPKRSRRKKPATGAASAVTVPVLPEAREAVKATLATIAAAAAHAHEHDHDHDVVVPEPTEVVEPTELEPTELEPTELEPTELEPVVEAEPVVEPVVEDEAQDQHDQHDQH
ncbi:Rne/Rng family ribonuclease, partial [Actinotalea sp.]|uniref:Rne/Rng family ribonuclease n=1 Tax=Actinotalea sp. TaxID=1872145 RepID=UPI002C08973F